VQPTHRLHGRRAALVGLLLFAFATAPAARGGPPVVTEYPIPTAQAGPAGMAPGPDGNVWFTEFGGNKIAKITPLGQITEYAVPTPDSGPATIVAGPDGNLWFTEFNGHKIGRITPSGQIDEFPLPAGAAPNGITAGPDGALWFTEQGAHNVGRITTDGAVTRYPVTAGSGPRSIAVGADGHLWFIELNTNKIGRMTTTGAPAGRFDIPTAMGDPRSLRPGPDGRLYFAEGTANKIGRVTMAGDIDELPLPTASSAPGAVTAGPDGNVWVTERNTGKVASVTPSGAITEYDLPTPGSGPNVIATGADGNLWIGETAANQIARFQLPTADPAPEPPGGAAQLATLTGRVLDDRGGGVPGAAVQVCGATGLACSQAIAGPEGRYLIAGLVPGDYDLVAFPPSRELGPGLDTLTLGVGERTYDLTLERLPGFSRQLSLLAPNGLFTAGQPSVDWGDPLTFRYEVTDLPREAAPGTDYTVRLVFTLSNGGDTVIFDNSARVSYGAERTIASVTPIATESRGGGRPAQSQVQCGGLLGTAKGRFKDFEAAHWQYTRAGGLLFGGVAGAILLNQTRAEWKDYATRAREYLDAGCPPEDLPCPVDFPQPGPIEVDVESTVTKEPNGEQKTDGARAAAYIDPSGTVRTTKGVPLSAAKVVLERRPSAVEPFAAVANGSVLMSPSNRRNPDRTDRLGRFGWDVLAGTYRVRARRRGCRAARGRGKDVFTRALDVPPPRLGLVLRLRCRPIRRVPTRVTLRASRGQLTARVTPRRGARGRPLGTVTFRARGRVLGEVPLHPRTRSATLTGRRTRGLRAIYSGDARFAASRGR
jgi:streptogramin lyase